MIQCNMVVLFTSDERGETLSIATNDELQYIVPFEPIDMLIQSTRKAR